MVYVTALSPVGFPLWEALLGSGGSPRFVSVPSSSFSLPDQHECPGLIARAPGSAGPLQQALSGDAFLFFTQV